MHHVARLCLLSFAIGSTEDLNFHIQPYLQRPEADAMTVMWETTGPTVGEVQYGLTPELRFNVIEKEARTVHELRLSGLLPGTRYYYRARCGDTWSETKSFQATPASDANHWRMVVYGDSRSFPDRHQRVAELAARFEPNLVLHTGDQVAQGTQRPQWKSQFFDPAAGLFSHVPVVTSLGNHEQNAANYFEYLALPGNERYFSFDFGNAHVVVLDSNDWGKSARQSAQYKWLTEDLSQKRSTKWNLVGFHHCLFSAHDKRPINSARWDWHPLFEDLGMDLVLTGHDHFYYRSWPIGRLSDKPSRGIVHVTTAGGGAPLYQLKERSYTAVEKAVYHVTVLDFQGDEIRGQAVDIDGNVFDQFRLTKDPTPASEFCAFEVYDLERSIRQAIEARPATVVDERQTEFALDEELVVPHTFQIPVSASLTWTGPAPAGEAPAVPVEIEPGKPLRIPLRTAVHPRETAALPSVRLVLQDERFRNRQIDFAAIKLWRDLSVIAKASTTAPPVHTLLDQEARASELPPYALVRSDGRGGAARPARLYVTYSPKELFVTTCVHDPHRKISLGQATPEKPDPAALLKGHHIRFLLATPSRNQSFIVSPQGGRALTTNQQAQSAELGWSAFSRREGDFWVVELAIPFKILKAHEGIRFNAVHFDPAQSVEDCLSPTFDIGTDPDRVPDFRFGDGSTDRFARLILQ